MSVFQIKNPEFVLIHIPKTGGTSIRKGLFQSDYDGPVMGRVPDEWMPLFKVAFVRNPFDRIISAWKMFSEGMKYSPRIQDDITDISFPDFLNIVTDESIPHDYEKPPSVEMKIRHHTLPFTHPYNCLQFADFIGRFESYRQDVSALLKELDHPVPTVIPEMNKTRHAGYAKYYTKETQRVVSQFYKQDCEQFNYRFEHE